MPKTRKKDERNKEGLYCDSSGETRPSPEEVKPMVDMAEPKKKFDEVIIRHGAVWEFCSKFSKICSSVERTEEKRERWNWGETEESFPNN